MSNSKCPFCEIASGNLPSSIVYDSEQVMAFMDLNPANDGHTLIIPKDHWENIFEIPEKVLSEVVKVVKSISIAVKKTVEADGIKVIQLNGKAAGQVVMHIHFHIIPINSSYKKKIMGYSRKSSDRKELDEIAKRIQENLNCGGPGRI